MIKNYIIILLIMMVGLLGAISATDNVGVLENGTNVTLGQEYQLGDNLTYDNKNYTVTNKTNVTTELENFTYYTTQRFGQTTPNVTFNFADYGIDTVTQFFWIGEGSIDINGTGNYTFTNGRWTVYVTDTDFTVVPITGMWRANAYYIGFSGVKYPVLLTVIHDLAEIITSTNNNNNTDENGTNITISKNTTMPEESNIVIDNNSDVKQESTVKPVLLPDIPINMFLNDDKALASMKKTGLPIFLLLLFVLIVRLRKIK